MVVFSVILLMLAGTQPAFSRDEDAQCRKITGHAKVVETQIPCLENPEFWGCIIAKVRGTLKGKWVAYQQDGWFDMDLGDPKLGLPVPPGFDWDVVRSRIRGHFNQEGYDLW